MTQKEKELLLVDLCGRLPYGVILSCCDTVGEKLTAIDTNPGILINNDYDINDINEVKPYLFPMSSMTEEQTFERRSYLSSIEGRMVGMQGRAIYIIDWCNKNHFDYRGLIPMGLAIDATGLNIY